MVLVMTGWVGFGSQQVHHPESFPKPVTGGTNVEGEEGGWVRSLTTT